MKDLSMSKDRVKTAAREDDGKESVEVCTSRCFSDLASWPRVKRGGKIGFERPRAGRGAGGF